MPDPAPEPKADGAPTFGPAVLSPVRLFYWSVRRELWENRFLYIVPLIVAALVLLGFAVGASSTPLIRAGGSASPNVHVVGTPLSFALFAVMLTYVIVTVVYCLGALHNERTDRSILFWKSLPVSDVTTVIAKASIPLLVLPLITFAILVVTQGIMMLAGSAVLLSKGVAGAAPWTQTPLLPLWAAMLYHLLTVHALLRAYLRLGAARLRLGAPRADPLGHPAGRRSPHHREAGFTYIGVRRHVAVAPGRRPGSD
jgi:ABC-2 type transport system permease protein